MIASGSRYIEIWKPLLVSAALVFMYATVLWKLGIDWWSDDNYSHGLLVPFVVLFIVWQRSDQLRNLAVRSGSGAGLGMIVFAAFLLLAGTLASVLYAQRMSMLVMLAGVVVYFFGIKVLRGLTVPFVLLFLAIPIPQLIFNKIAFPLQLLASRAADFGIQFLGIASDRMGNLIEIPHAGTGEIVSLEVVEACSGIRSLVTLMTLGLILAYFTRGGTNEDGMTELSGRDLFRAAVLMAAAVPVALLTNAGRVMVTGVIAHYYGQEATEGIWHDVSGGLVFVSALLLLLLLNAVMKRLQGDLGDGNEFALGISYQVPRINARKVVILVAVVFVCGAFVNWFQYRGELHVERRELRELPARLGAWEQRNEDIRFDPESEKVLRATDYVMRDYYGPGKRLNLYVGYYSSQRSGATYHSPLSCLPGTGWELADPQILEITSPAGKRFQVNRYIVRQGDHSEYLIYWYQGRGRRSASEYVDKIYTSIDSVMKRRSDGGMVRLMTPLGKDPDRSLAAAIDLTGHVADGLDEFVPD